MLLSPRSHKTPLIYLLDYAYVPHHAPLSPLEGLDQEISQLIGIFDWVSLIQLTFLVGTSLKILKKLLWIVIQQYMFACGTWNIKSRDAVIKAAYLQSARIFGARWEYISWQISHTLSIIACRGSSSKTGHLYGAEILHAGFRRNLAKVCESLNTNTTKIATSNFCIIPVRWNQYSLLDLTLSNKRRCTYSRLCGSD